MAKRYSGDLQISVVYDDKNHYRTAVSRGGKLLWRGVVRPAPAGFGPGVAYDSPRAYDEVASSALAFADHDVGGISDEAEYDEDLTGFLIRRSPRAKASKASTRQHAMMKRSPAQLDREIDRALAAKGPSSRHAIARRDVTVEDLSSRQRGLLRDLRRAKEYHHPLSVEVSKDDVARQLASLGLLRIEPDDDLGLTWVTVTPRGRDVAIKGGLWGRR